MKIYKTELLKIAGYDGVTIIMSGLWILFVIVFLKAISFYQNGKSTYNKKKKAEINNTIYGIHSTEGDDDSEIKPKINIFDKMKYVGELLEKIIQNRFTR